MRVRDLLIGIMIGLCFMLAAMVRYEVGRAVPANVYTVPFEADGIYKFMQTNYGEPNKPKIQSAPDDWIKQFGNNERTLLFHTLSELRIVVAAQAKRIAALEDPNIVNK